MILKYCILFLDIPRKNDIIAKIRVHNNELITSCILKRRMSWQLKRNNYQALKALEKPELSAKSGVTIRVAWNVSYPKKERIMPNAPPVGWNFGFSGSTRNYRESGDRSGMSIERSPRSGLSGSMQRHRKNLRKREANKMALDRKIAYINLTTGDIEVKPIPIEVRRKFLGGRGLDAYLLYNHAPKGCDPVGPDNPLIISAGILTATCASANPPNPGWEGIFPRRR